MLVITFLAGVVVGVGGLLALMRYGAPSTGWEAINEQISRDARRNNQAVSEFHRKTGTEAWEKAEKDTYKSP